jgi:hypothetical protein
MRMLSEPIHPGDTQTCEVPQGWTPEQQMAHMLELCEAQMESAMSESDQAVDALIKAFTGLADTTRSIGSVADQVPTEVQQATAAAVDRHVAAIREQIASAVVAFQFYDKLTQRLGHVRYSLSTLAMFVCDRSQASQREQWERLFSTLRRLYRTEEEREIFQLMVNGASAEDARAQAEQHSEERGGVRSGDIELF